MKSVFVDISAFEALLNRMNPCHESAKTFLGTTIVRKLSLISSRQVLFTLADQMRQAGLTSVSADVIQALCQSELILFENFTAEDEQETWRIYKSMTDTWWTFSRCASMALMNRLNISTVFGFELGYTQFGLQVVPKDTQR